MCISDFINCTGGAKDPLLSRRRFIQSFHRVSIAGFRSPVNGGVPYLFAHTNDHAYEGRLKVPYFFRSSRRLTISRQAQRNRHMAQWPLQIMGLDTMMSM